MPDCIGSETPDRCWEGCERDGDDNERSRKEVLTNDPYVSQKAEGTRDDVARVTAAEGSQS